MRKCEDDTKKNVNTLQKRSKLTKTRQNGFRCDLCEAIAVGSQISTTHVNSSAIYLLFPGSMVTKRKR